MAPLRNGRVIFSAVPETFPEPGKHITYDDSHSIDLDTVPVNGGLLVKTLVLSNDPYLRERMRDPSVDVISYTPPYRLNEPIENHAVGKVLRSESPDYKPGDIVYGILPFQEYFVFDADRIKVAKAQLRFKPLEIRPDVPLTAYVGACGMPGQTAYYGWRAFAEPKKGETIFVTTAAGPVGSLVVQLAKAAGLKVIASAGSDSKVQFAREVGAEVAFNYKTVSTAEVLEKEGPINIFWDNVGGETLAIALANAAPRARFIECGQMSGYNSGYPAVRNVEQIFVRALKVYGLLVFNHKEYERDFFKEIPPKVARGEIKYREDIKRGLENAPQAIFEVQRGFNEGKSVIVVADG